MPELLATSRRKSGIVTFAVTKDASGTVRDLVFREVNEVAGALFGVASPHRLVGRSLNRVLGRHASGFRDQAERALAAHARIETEIDAQAIPQINAQFLFQQVDPIGDHEISMTLLDVTESRLARRSLRVAVDTSLDSLVVLRGVRDADTDRLVDLLVVDCNQLAATMLGRDSCEAVVGWTVRDLLPTRATQLIDDCAEAINSHSNHQSRIDTREETDHAADFVLQSIVPLGDDQVAVTARDISGEVDALAREEGATQRLLGIVRAGLDCFAVLAAVRDDLGNLRDIMIVDANENFARLHSSDRERIIGTRVSRLIGQRADGFIAKCARVLDTREPIEDEVDVRDLPAHRADYVRHQITPVGNDELAFTTRDITEEIASRGRERQMHNRLSAALHGGLDGFAVIRAIRDADGEITEFLFTDANDRAAWTLGLDSGPEVLGTRFSDLSAEQLGPTFARARGQIEKDLRHTLLVQMPMEREIGERGAADTTVAYRYHMIPIGNDEIALHVQNITDAVVAQARERVTQHRLQSVLHLMSDGFILMQAQWGAEGELSDLIVLDINHAAAAIKQIEPSQLIGRGLRSLGTAFDPSSLLLDHAKEVLHGGAPTRFEVDHAGRLLWLQIFRTAPDEIAVISADVTAQRRAQARLEQNEARLRGAIDANLDYVVMYEPVFEDGEVVDFSITDLNQRAADSYGSPSEEVVGQALSSFNPRPTFDAYLEMMKGVLATGIPVSGEFPVLDADGNPRTGEWLEQEIVRSGAGVTAAWRDISARKRSEQRFRAAIDAAMDAVIFLEVIGSGDDVGFRIVDANERAAAAYQIDKEQMLGRMLFELGPTPTYEEIRPVLMRVAASGVGQTGDMSVQSSSGEQIWISYQVVAVDNGMAVGWRNISERVRHEKALGDLVERQASLLRLAEVSASAGPRAVFQAMATEIVDLFNAEIGAVLSFTSSKATIEGVDAPKSAELEVGMRFPLKGETIAGQISRDPRPLVISDYSGHNLPAALVKGRRPMGSGMGVPLRVDGRLWGALTLHSSRIAAFGPAAIEDLRGFAELAAVFVSEAEGRAQLARLAATDHLTQVANYRTFQMQLSDEIDQARRRARPLSLVIFDLDNFKQVNDAHGHAVGDSVLQEVARRLVGVARPGALLSRIGGEEFAWILPDANGNLAYALADRARKALASAPFAGVGTVTCSAGVSELSQADGPPDLFRYADGALYWAKANGRNATCLYNPEIVQDLSVHERLERLGRHQVMTGLRALARAIDARDPSTRRHSERVAVVATMLADEMGWSADQCRRLREAALVHDVGKIGVPDAVLFKPAQLDPDEFLVIQAHVSLGAQIAAEVLDSEQADWILHHHERADGSGYPDGLTAGRISDGAAILSLADAWDAMTSERPYQTRLTADQALVEVRRRVGTHFSPRVVTALTALLRRGAITEAES